MTQPAIKSTHDQNLTRSAIAPEIRAGVITANISWNITNAVAGNASEPGHATGGGPVTALAYVLTLEDPQRFAQSRDVGAYLGLVPKQEDSGDSQPQLRITKMGDRMVRRLLVGSAHYILGPFGPDTDLRRYGLRLSERGGKNAKKRAAVAVARKKRHR